MSFYGIARPVPILPLACFVLLASCVGARRPVPGPEPPSDEELLRSKARILRAEDRRVVDQDLLSALGHSAGPIRTLAIRALGRIGDPAYRSRIEAGLGDENEGVRGEAAFALGLLGEPASLPALHELLDDRDLHVRALLAMGLGLFDDPAAAEGLLRLLADPDPNVVLAACHALAGFSRAGIAVDELIRRTSDDSTPVAEAATLALARFSAAPAADPADFAPRRRARRHLVQLAGSSNPRIRQSVAAGLSVPAGAGEADALITLIRDPDPLVRINAVRSFSFPGSPIDPYLREALADTDERVVLAAVQGLARLSGQDVIDTLVDLIVRDDRPWVRERAVTALRTVDPDEAAALANGLSRFEEPRVRRAAAGLLLGRSDEAAIEYAGRLLVDAVPVVRRAAIPAMAGAPGSLADVLGDLIRSSDPADRIALARAAGWRLADAERSADDRDEALRMLSRLWDDSQEPPDVDVLGAVLDAAARGRADPRSREILEGGLGSTDRRIRVQAIDLLGRIYGEDHSAAAGPAADHPLEHYIEILRWSKTSRAAIVTVERPGFIPGRFTLRLNTRVAPLTCWRFVHLADEGYYSRLPVRRVLPHASLRIGAFDRAERERPHEALRDEISPHWFEAGTLVMASSGKDTAEADWIVTLAPQPQWSGRYTSFGRVVQNFEGVAALALPDDIVVSIETYEGTGKEPLPSRGRAGPGRR